ncbi:MAG: penicillin-binding protein 2 [Duodenibacillus sp.]|nr:penicillin-binding protein 2 [Duodenibacillus sp.]
MALHRTSSLRDLALFRSRMGLAVVFVFFVLGLLLVRLSYLQLLREDHYKAVAESNRTVTVPITPSRGEITDRNGEVIARNYRAFSLEITPGQTNLKNVDGLIDELAKVIEITPSNRRRFKRLREESRRFEPVPIRTRLTDEEVARFVSQRWRFPGVNVMPEEYRDYPCGATASHMLGYVGRISRADIEAIEGERKADDYQGLRVMGKVGIERSYESTLKGRPGHEKLEVTAGGRPVGDMGVTGPQPGRNLELTVDMNLQRVAEAAFGKERGVAVAIDPRNGEVLAFVSMPTYDPNAFVDGIDPDTWKELSQSPDKPLLNRVARGLYPIGSTYKPFMALAGLKHGVITPKTTINDTGVFTYYNHRFRDSSRVAKGQMNLHRSIVTSSDVYYYWLASELGVQKIHDFMALWGFGQQTGVDIMGEQAGTLPDPEWKMKRFKKPWVPGDTISLGIGQGYNQFTILQLANATATLAARGKPHVPHLVRRVKDAQTRGVQRVRSPALPDLPVAKEHIEAVIAGMADVPRAGTARQPFEGVRYSVAGKTGTAQVFTVAQNKTYDASKLARNRHDHGLFIAFAPVDRPQIAVAVLCENGGFGAKSAAPIARKMLDYWLLGENRLGLEPPRHVQARSAAAARKAGDKAGAERSGKP